MPLHHQTILANFRQKLEHRKLVQKRARLTPDAVNQLIQEVLANFPSGPERVELVRKMRREGLQPLRDAHGNLPSSKPAKKDWI